MSFVEKFDKYLFILCNVVFGALLVWIAFDNLTHLTTAISYAKYKGIWLAEIGTPLIQAWLGLAGLCVLSGYRRREGLLMFMIFLVIVTPFMHNFWALSEQERLLESKFFQNNLFAFTLTGMLYVFAKKYQWPYTLADLRKR